MFEGVTSENLPEKIRDASLIQLESWKNAAERVLGLVQTVPVAGSSASKEYNDFIACLSKAIDSKKKEAARGAARPDEDNPKKTLEKFIDWAGKLPHKRFVQVAKFLSEPEGALITHELDGIQVNIYLKTLSKDALEKELIGIIEKREEAEAKRAETEAKRRAGSAKRKRAERIDLTREQGHGSSDSDTEGASDKKPRTGERDVSTERSTKIKPRNEPAHTPVSVPTSVLVPKAKPASKEEETPKRALKRAAISDEESEEGSDEEGSGMEGSDEEGSGMEGSDEDGSSEESSDEDDSSEESSDEEGTRPVKEISLTPKASSVTSKAVPKITTDDKGKSSVTSKAVPKIATDDKGKSSVTSKAVPKIATDDKGKSSVTSKAVPKIATDDKGKSSPTGSKGEKKKKDRSQKGKKNKLSVDELNVIKHFSKELIDLTVRTDKDMAKTASYVFYIMTNEREKKSKQSESDEKEVSDTEAKDIQKEFKNKRKEYSKSVPEIIGKNKAELEDHIAEIIKETFKYSKDKSEDNNGWERFFKLLFWAFQRNASIWSLDRPKKGYFETHDFPHKTKTRKKLQKRHDLFIVNRFLCDVLLDFKEKGEDLKIPRGLLKWKTWFTFTYIE